MHLIAIPIPTALTMLLAVSARSLAAAECANPCGYYGQLCCASGQYCYTDANNQAQCGQSQTDANCGNWISYTTTYVETVLKTITTVYSTYVPVSTVPAPTLSCLFSEGETPCGSCCCFSGQYCASEGVCKVIDEGASCPAYYSCLNIITISPAQFSQSSYSAHE